MSQGSGPGAQAVSWTLEVNGLALVENIPGENISIKEENVQRVTNGRAEARGEREQEECSGKEIEMGEKERHIKYICILYVHIYV